MSEPPVMKCGISGCGEDASASFGIKLAEGLNEDSIRMVYRHPETGAMHPVTARTLNGHLAVCTHHHNIFHHMEHRHKIPGNGNPRSN